MQLKHIRLITCIALLSLEMAHASGAVYQVEPKSTGNTITLDVTNKLISPLSGLSAVVLRRPSWVNVRNASVDVASLPVDSTGHIAVAFDIVQGVQRGEASEVAIALFAGKSLVMQKTISLTVAVPTKYELGQNYPNPFNPSTTIHYQVPADGFITLKVFDLLGREVATLVNEEQKADYYKVTFDASRLASGVYFYRLQAGEFTAAKRLMVLK
jgi:hypothetical protein